jgi:hypothetical protein
MSDDQNLWAALACFAVAIGLFLIWYAWSS